MTSQSHMTRQLVFVLPGQVKKNHGFQGQSRHVPRAVRNADSTFLYGPSTVYMHKTDVRSDLSIFCRPRHRAHPLPLVSRQSYLGIL
jgi:hypothetical protein